MTNLEHARQIMNFLAEDNNLTEIPDWKIVNKPKSYHLKITDGNVIFEYKMVVDHDPQEIALLLGEGKLEPLKSFSKQLYEDELSSIMSMPRRQRRKALRQRRKYSYRNLKF